MKIYTHMNVDLDAVASVWWMLRFKFPGAEIVFVPANWDGSGMEAGDVAVDIEAGGKGIKGELKGGVRHSCFSTLVLQHGTTEDMQALASLMAFVDAQDAYGSAYTHFVPEAKPEARRVLLHCGVNAVLRAFQAMHYNDDMVVCERMSEIFDGMLKNGRNRRRAEEEAQTAEIVGGRVAILRDPKSVTTTIILLEEHGLDVVIYADGCNLGAVRRNDLRVRMDHPAIRAATNGEDGWFFHPAGFLAARGTRKAPATTPSRVDPNALAQAVLEALQDSH